MENDDLNIRFRTVVALIIILALLISLIVFFHSNFNRKEYIFFYPDHQTGNSSGEIRRTPGFFFKNEKNLEIFVRELLLGPLDMKLDPLFSSGTKVEKMLYRNRIVYLDLNLTAFKPDKKVIHGFDKGIMFLEENIKFNFPFVNKVVITISGEEPKKAVKE